MEPYAFDRILMRESAEIVAQEMSERIKAIRLSVITETRKYLSQYARLGYMPELQCAIAKRSVRGSKQFPHKSRLADCRGRAARPILATGLYRTI